MTKSVKTDRKLRRQVDWAAFLLALACPLALFGIPGWVVMSEGIATLSLLGVGTFAVMFGAPSYLTFGSAFFIRRIWRLPRTIGGFALSGVVANITAAPAAFVVFALFAYFDGGGSEFGYIAVSYVLAGVPFSAAWGAIFGWLYRRLDRRPDGDIDPEVFA